MKLKRAIVANAAAAMLGSAMLFPPAFAAAPDPSGFSALQGVEVHALSVDEMKAITGELNAYDIAAALGAQALAATNPRVAKALADLSLQVFNNAVEINAVFSKLNILTPCKVCVPQ
jgi:hypothetical protein